MEVSKLFTKETIFLDVDVSTERELFKLVADELLKKEYVKDGYFEGLVDREEIFPTGLKMKKYGVAIPHTNPEYISKDFVAVVRPKQPIKFALMEDNETSDFMDLCFFIGLKDGKESPIILVKLVALMQNEELILSILEENDIEKVSKRIVKNINEEV